MARIKGGMELSMETTRMALVKSLGVKENENYFMVVGIIVCDKEHQEAVMDRFDYVTDVDELGADLVGFLKMSGFEQEAV